MQRRLRDAPQEVRIRPEAAVALGRLARSPALPSGGTVARPTRGESTMTLDQARQLALEEPQRVRFATQAAYRKATKARERLVCALGAACQPDPPMRIVVEALRCAEEYSVLLDALARGAAEPVEMTPSEAMAMLSWCRPPAPRTAPTSPPPAAGLDSKERPEATLDLMWDLGHSIGCFVGRIARAIGGGG